MLNLSKNQLKQLFYYKCDNCGTSLLNYLDITCITVYEDEFFIKTYCSICKNSELRTYSINLKNIKKLKEN